MRRIVLCYDALQNPKPLQEALPSASVEGGEDRW